VTVNFCYGRRDEQLIHVGDLDRELERGLPCNCVCPECGRALQAHLGAKKAWHFQHQAKDVNCNPQPMTLLHAFVRDELAKKKHLVIPRVHVPVEFEELGKVWTATVHLPETTLHIISAEAERRFEEVQPDVYYELENEGGFAIEVRYTHAVDEAKVAKLRRSVSRCVELDVSDLPAAGIGRAAFEQLLLNPERWTWLTNHKIIWDTMMLREGVRWANSAWSLKSRPNAIPKAAGKAQAKQRKAEARLPWAKAQLAKLRVDGAGPLKSMHWLGAQDKVDRVAVACAALGISPTALPDFFLQTIQGKNARAIAHHPYSWQVVVFMKFGVGFESFTGHSAAEWTLAAMPDRTEIEDGAKSLNGFTRTAALLQTYFLDLEAQGLLTSDGSKVLETRTFTPKFGRSSELRDFLAGVTATSP
jgi:hypothetical protein